MNATEHEKKRNLIMARLRSEIDATAWRIAAADESITSSEITFALAQLVGIYATMAHEDEINRTAPPECVEPKSSDGSVPEGYRPLVDGEKIKAGDIFLMFSPGSDRTKISSWCEVISIGAPFRSASSVPFARKIQPAAP